MENIHLCYVAYAEFCIRLRLIYKMCLAIMGQEINSQQPYCHDYNFKNITVVL